jgi:ketosteroid isomerase-like protein
MQSVAFSSTPEVSPGIGKRDLRNTQVVSQANVEVLLRLWETWNEQGEVAVIARDFWDADIEWHLPPEWTSVASRIARGREAVMRQSQEFAEHMGHFLIEVVEVVDAGDEVFASLRYHARGTKSEAEVALPVFHVTRVREGRVLRVRVFATREDAARAAGLDPVPEGESS